MSATENFIFEAKIRLILRVFGKKAIFKNISVQGFQTQNFGIPGPSKIGISIKNGICRGSKLLVEKMPEISTFSTFSPLIQDSWTPELRKIASKISLNDRDTLKNIFLQ